MSIFCHQFISPAINKMLMLTLECPTCLYGDDKRQQRDVEALCDIREGSFYRAVSEAKESKGWTPLGSSPAGTKH